MNRVIVTGATSMIGVALINECIAHHVEVLAIVRKHSMRKERLPETELLEILECEMGQFGSIKRREKAYDVFYHFAWACTSKETRDDPLLQEENICCTLEAAKLAYRLGCRKFVGAGSQAEYGRVEHMIRPDTAVNPHLSYGIAKYAAGRLSHKLCERYGMIHIWGRIFSVYGSNDNDGTMLSYAIDQFVRWKAARFSSGLQMWDYLHEDDAGRIFYLLGECVDQDRIYCIASGESRPLKEFILEMQDAFGSDAKCEFAPDAGCPSEGLQADVSELFRDISYRPDVKFEEGIKKMIRYRIENVKKGEGRIDLDICCQRCSERMRAA